MKKEDFEIRGWEFNYEFDGKIVFRKGNIWADGGEGAFLEVINNKIKLTTTDEGFNSNGPNFSIKFHGTCKNMEQFDMICEMIGLKI